MTATLPSRPRSRRLPGAGPGLWRAPGQAVRSPGMAAALAAAVALLAFAATVRPLFVDGVGDATLADALESYRPETLGATVSVLGSLDESTLSEADEALGAYAAGRPLDAPVAEVRPREAGVVLHPDDGEPVTVQYPIGFPASTVQLYGRTGATAHLPDAEGGGSGIWVPRRVADAAGVEPGEALAFEMRGQVVDLPVAGTYRDLVEAVPTSAYSAPGALPEDHPVTEYWAPREGLIAVLAPDGTASPAPPLLVGEPDVVAGLGGAAFGPPTHTSFTFPLPADAHSVRAVEAVGALFADLEVAAVDRTEPLGQALHAASDVPGSNVHVSSLLEPVVERPRVLTATLDASLAPVARGAQALALVALLGVGAAAARRRRAEHTLLGVQGVGAGWMATRAAAEASLPAFAGGLVGGAVAVAVVPLLGPGGVPAAHTLRATAGGAFAAALAGVAVWAVVAVVARPRLGVRSSGRVGRFARRVPWEALLVAAAVAAGSALAGRDGGLLVGEEGARRVDVLAVAFPVLAVAAAGGLAARLLGRAGGRLRRTGRRAPPSLWLAARGLAAATGPARAALGATAVGVGLATFGLVAAASVDATVEGKAAAAGGGQTAVTLAPHAEVADIGVAHTEVFRTSGTVNPAGREVEVLAIDPDTFAAAAVWTDAFADEPLEELLAALQAYGSEGEALPVLAVGLSAGAVEGLRTDRYEIALTPVATPRAFPGMGGAPSVLVADRERLVAAAAEAGANIDELLVLRRRREVWLAGDREAARSLEGGFHLGQQSVRGIDDVRDRAELRAAVWTLRYLRAVGVAAGGLALVGLLGYALARHRRRAAGLALAGRMGLSPRAARGALAAEVGGLGLGGALVGAAAGVGAAWAVVAALDPLPGQPPDAFLAVPARAVVLAVLAVPILAAVGGLIGARAANRARVGALLRDG